MKFQPMYKWMIEPEGATEDHSRGFRLIRRSDGGSTSYHFDTFDQAESRMKEWKEKYGTCHECGDVIDQPYRENGIRCFHCGFWMVYEESQDNPRHAIIDGMHYMVGAEEASRDFRGFAGRKFIVNFFDGRVVETTNLWHQGTILPWFRDRMPDNAEFGVSE